MTLGTIAGEVGRGLAAGLAGTAAMTASSMTEARLRHRSSSSTPADAASKVLGVAPVDDEGEQRFNNLVHWAYGTAWGSARGLLGALPLSPGVASAAHFGAVWGAEQVVLPATGAGQPATRWPATEIAVDVFHHAVYAAVTGAAFTWLRRRSC